MATVKHDKKAAKRFPELGRAVSSKNLEAVTKLLAAGVDPDLQPHNMLGDSLLRFAVNRGTPLPIIRLLVEHGAKFDAKNAQKLTPIDAALAHGREDVIDYFASKGAKVKFVPFAKLPQTEKNQRLASVLDDWYAAGCADRLSQALEGGADANAQVDALTPIQRIAGQGDLSDLFELLLKAGGDPKAAYGDGDTPVHLAARHGYAATTMLFLLGGVATDFRDGAGNTPLHRAAGDGYNGAHRVVTLLLDRGADPMLRNKAGQTVLDAATQTCKQLILKRVGKPLSEGAAALLAAVVANDAKKVAKLLKMGADPSEVDEVSGKGYGSGGLSGVAAIHVALGPGVDRAIVDLLLAVNVNVGVKSVDGRTPLHMVMRYGKGEDRLRIVERLIALGADVNATNARSETPIFEATSFSELDGELELIDTLLAAGADTKRLDHAQESPLDQMFEHTQRFHEVSDKPGFVAVMAKLIELRFVTSNKKAIDAWLKAKGAKYAPKAKAEPKLEPKNAKPKLEPTKNAKPKLEPTKNAKPKLEPTKNAKPKLEPTKNAKAKPKPKNAKPKLEPKNAKPAPASPQRLAFDRITGGKLDSYVDASTTVLLAGKRRPVALFDWFAYVAEYRDDKSDWMMQIAEYHLGEDAVDRVTKTAWIPFGVVGMNGSLDSYREVGVDGTLYLDLAHATASDAPVIFATQSYMGLAPATPLKVGKLEYRALMRTLKQ